MRAPVTYLIIFLLTLTLLAQRKAQVINPDTDIYSEADFDSSVLGTIDPEESFLVSKKLYGPFYKIKLKDGTIGYVPDTDLNIQGVGAVVPRSYRGDESENPTKAPKEKPEELDEDTENPNLAYKGLIFQMINFREDTMGAVHVADLPTLGFRYQPLEGNYQSSLAYDVFVSPEAPGYYAEKTGGDVSGAIFWGSANISHVSAMNSNTSWRYGAGPFFRYSYFSIKNATLRPNTTYNLQDLNVGLDFQIGALLHSRYFTIDLGLRYFWDKEPYGAFGVGFLF